MLGSVLKVRVALSIVLVTVFGVVFGSFLLSLGTEAAFAADLNSIKGCQAEKSPIICSLPYIRHMLTLRTGAEVMKGIAQTVTYPQCHFEGHAVGQQLYARNHDMEASIMQCGRECDSACLHGIIGEAFTEDLGFGYSSTSDGFDLQHINRNDLHKYGAELCRTAEACHGVGHIVFQIAKSVGAGMKLCEDFAPKNTLSTCYNGVIMEYADVLTSRSSREQKGVTAPPISTLKSFCLLPTSDRSRACFRYFARFVVATLKPVGYSLADALKETRRICESYPKGENRLACMASIGSYNNSLSLTNPAAARDVCTVFADKHDEASCILGQVYTAISDRKEGLARYCSSLPKPDIRYVCYQGLFHYAFWVGENMTSAGTLCAAGNEACQAGLQAYRVDSFEVISRI